MKTDIEKELWDKAKAEIEKIMDCPQLYYSSDLLIYSTNLNIDERISNLNKVKTADDLVKYATELNQTKNSLKSDELKCVFSLLNHDLIMYIMKHAGEKPDSDLNYGNFGGTELIKDYLSDAEEKRMKNHRYTYEEFMNLKMEGYNDQNSKKIKTLASDCKKILEKMFYIVQNFSGIDLTKTDITDTYKYNLSKPIHDSIFIINDSASTIRLLLKVLNIAVINILSKQSAYRSCLNKIVQILSKYDDVEDDTSAI